jgi:hypothetical protein
LSAAAARAIELDLELALQRENPFEQFVDA